MLLTTMGSEVNLQIEIIGNQVVGGTGSLLRMESPIIDGRIEDNLAAGRAEDVPGFNAVPLDHVDSGDSPPWPFDPEDIGPAWQKC